MTVDEFIVNSQVLGSVYGHVPQLGGDLRLRSVNISWIGPTVTLRVDLPSFPDPAPQGWREAGVDTVQCQMQFFDVDNMYMDGWVPPVFVRVGITSWAERRRIRVDVRVKNQPSPFFFECSNSVVVGHVSAFRIRGDGADEGVRVHMNRLDSHLYGSLPATSEKVYYERI